jgi:hypothetical protein
VQPLYLDRQVGTGQVHRDLVDRGAGGQSGGIPGPGDEIVEELHRARYAQVVRRRAGAPDEREHLPVHGPEDHIGL